MLRRLSITNYLLIDALELDLGKGLTIITGETGSGKSIVIGALGLAMGDRAEAGVARDAAKRCVIELEIDAKGLGLEDWCEAHGILHEPLILLRRQIDPGSGIGIAGRSRAFVNDTPVKLEQLRELGERLVHVHSQHQTLLLNDPGFQLGLIDHVAGLAPKVAIYAQCHGQWRTAASELERVREEEARSRAELDYLRFQLNELDAATLREDEQPTLEQELSRAENAEVLVNVYRSTEEGLSGDDGALNVLATIKAQVGRIAALDKEAGSLLERLEGARLELKDVADEAARLASQISVDQGEAERMRDRLDLLIRLQQKHRVKDPASLIALREDLRERTTRIGSLGEQIATLEKEEARLHKEVLELAASLSKERDLAIPPLQEEVSVQLRDLGMPHARFSFERSEGQPGPRGIDRVRALFSANKDRSPETLEKVASGGELSRVMLALLGLAAESRSLPTVIFDEIDSGVSGETAHRVGALLARMAKDRQVIAITHLPQIASKADTHLLVSKDQEAEVVTTRIRPLKTEERVNALAQMLSGKKTGKAAVENARELLKNR